MSVSESESTVSNSVSVAAISASRQGQLDRILDAGLVKQGRVFSLSLKAIQEQLGPRWEQRKDHVWEALERALSRKMPPPDVFMRIEDTTVLAAIASSNAYDAQMKCAEVLRSVLTFFLGRSADEDVDISRVSGLQDGLLTCEAVDLTAPPSALSAFDAAPEPDAAARTPDQWTPPLAGRSYAAPFRDRRGEVVPMVLDVTAVWRLDDGIIGAYALRRRFPQRMGPLNDQEREQVDNATFDRLIELLEEYQREGGLFALIAPIYFETISSRRSRINLLGRCSNVISIMRQAVVLEIQGINSGMPHGRLQEAASMMRPFVHSTMANVMEGAVVESVMREYPFSALVAEVGGRSQGFDRLSYLLTAMRRRTRNVMVHRVPPKAEAFVRSLGVTHITLQETDSRLKSAPSSTLWPDEPAPSPARPPAARRGGVTPGGSAPASAAQAHPATG